MRSCWWFHYLCAGLAAVVSATAAVALIAVVTLLAMGALWTPRLHSATGPAIVLSNPFSPRWSQGASLCIQAEIDSLLSVVIV